MHILKFRRGFFLGEAIEVRVRAAIYHGMSRGDRQEAIFLDDEDRWRFLKTLGAGCEKAGWQVHAYCD